MVVGKNVWSSLSFPIYALMTWCLDAGTTLFLFYVLHNKLQILIVQATADSVNALLVVWKYRLVLLSYPHRRSFELMHGTLMWMLFQCRRNQIRTY